MKNEITFITGNTHKLEEAQSMVPCLVGKAVDLPEIQSMTPQEVIEAKLIAAEPRISGGYVVEDTSLSIDSMGGLPGPLIKWFLQSVGVEGLADMASRSGESVAAEAITMIGYSDEHGEKRYFTGVVKGTIITPRGETGFGWDTIFIPDGYKETFAEMSSEQKNKISMRKKAFAQLAEHLKEQGIT